MKIALIGDHPGLYFISQKLHELGAELFFIGNHLPGERHEILATSFPDEKSFHLNQFEMLNSQENFFFENQVRIKKGHVVRVQKMFFTKKHQHRMQDQFKVVYSEKPDLAGTEALNLAAREKNDLELKLENFITADFVIFFPTETFLPQWAGVADAPALNEKRLAESGKIFYGLDCFDPEVLKNLNDQHITIVGDDPLALALLQKLFKRKRTEEKFEILSVCTNRAWFKIDPLDQDNHHKKITQKQSIQEIVSQVKSDLAQQELLYRNQRSASDSRHLHSVAEPTPLLQKLHGYGITSIDALSDQPGLFLTLEAIEQDRSAPLLTRRTDKVLVLNGGRDVGEILSSLKVSNISSVALEPGFYWPQNIQAIFPAIDNMLQFFHKLDD
jgi:hypothetical protein